jgi:hypothetical protein
MRETEATAIIEDRVDVKVVMMEEDITEWVVSKSSLHIVYDFHNYKNCQM